MGAEKEKNGHKNAELKIEEHEPQGCWENWEQFPKTVFAIFGNEFCERFSYYGMRTVLTLYVVNILGFNDSNSIALFHGFIVLCYSSPILGSILADGYIGKFHTILWISLFYACGNIVLAIAACYDKTSTIVHPGVDLLGLIIIGLGTGGIKPCVSPFGGDQFVAGQEKMLEAFFHVFYFSINAGALISSFITPMLRVMGCLGQDTCYPAAFGMPAALMVVSVVCFVLGSPFYKKFPPQENVIMEVLQSIHIAVRNKRKYSVERGHWMEHYLDDHDCHLNPKCTATKCHAAQYVEDIKAVLRQVVMCIPMPVFWALYDQQGSVWVLQAVAMDGRLWKGANLLPDQMQTLNAALILIFLPIFEFIIYPIVRKCGINPTPLRRMTVGGFMIAGCFIISMFVQLAVQKTLPKPPAAGKAHLTFINTLPCNILLTPIGTHPATGFQAANVSSNGSYYFDNLALVMGKNQNVTWTLTAPTSCNAPSTVQTNIIEGQTQYAIVSTVTKQARTTYPAALVKSTTGEGQFKLNINYYLQQDYPDFGGTFFWCKTGKACIPKYEDDFEAVTGVKLDNATDFHELKPAKWTLWYTNKTAVAARNLTGTWWSNKPYFTHLEDYHLKVSAGVQFEIEGQGGIYSLTLTNQKNGTILQTFYTIAPENKMSILWQVPQYIVVTAAEILFSVTGLEFSYSQAPLTMKSVVGALWLLTNAFGDLLVLAIEESGAFPNLAYEQLAFAVIMIVVMVVFMLLAIFWYEYSHFINRADEEETVEETSFENGIEAVVDKQPPPEEEKKKRRHRHKHRDEAK